MSELDDDLSKGRKRPRQGKSGKLKKPKEDPYQVAYRNFTYTPVQSTGKPGTPHRFFSESYQVKQRNSVDCDKSIRIHKHVNGLCVVTTGDYLKDSTVESVEIVLKEAPASSGNAKRKQQSAMLRGKKLDEPGIVSPGSTLCQITCGGDEQEVTTVDIPCGVWGTLLEVNPRLTADLLQRDPLLSGYVGIILPTGPFPPPSQDERKDAEKEAALVPTTDQIKKDEATIEDDS